MFKGFKIYTGLLLILAFFALALFSLHLVYQQRTTASARSVEDETAKGWHHLSTTSGDLPAPTDSTQQTSALILDIDLDGHNDFVIGARRSPGPSLVWYRRLAEGWERYVIDDSVLRLEAGGTFTDIDGDGDLDIVMGGDGGSNQVWWWENPYPDFNPTTNWTRRLIKNSGANKHHDQIFGDFDGDGRDELVYWNQGARTLFLAEIPANPRTAGTWPSTAIYTWTTEVEHEGLAKEDTDGDGLVDIVGGGRWFKFNGGTNFSPKVIDSAQTFSRAAAGQLREGGYSETVFVIGDGVGPINWYEWDGTEWIGHALIDQDIDHGHSLQVEDIDGDGHQDVFLAEMRLDGGNPNAKIWIFYGDGNGNFTTSVVATGFGSHEAKVGDLDGDGDVDLLGKPYNWDSPRVDIWLSDLACEPSLDSWERHEIDANKPWRALFIESADIDGDKLKDVVTGGWWYKNPGSAGGAWVRNTIGSPLNNVATVYDFDRDGDMDVLGTEGQGSTANPNFVWARNDGTGNFKILDNIEPGKGDFLQGVAANTYGATNSEVALSWHRSNSGVQMLSVPGNPASQTWAWREISTVTQDEDLSVGDIDRDGDRDLLLGTKWLRNDITEVTGWTDSAKRYRLPLSVAANGFERRNKPAEAEVNFTSLLNNLGQSGRFDNDSIRVVEVDASGQTIDAAVPFEFNPATDYDASSNALGTLIILINGETLASDKRRFQLYFDTVDLGPLVPYEQMTVFGFGRDGNAKHLSNDNQFTIGFADQVNYSSVQTTVNSAFQPLAVDLGRPETTSIAAESGPWKAFRLSNNGGDPDRNELADINQDGRLDAVVGYEAVSVPGFLAWYEAPATPTNIWTEHTIASIIGPMSLDVADMDGDGDLDIVAGEHSTSDPTSAKLHVFENVDGQGQSWQEHVVYIGDEHHDGAQIVDIDSDGDLDIISIGWTHGRVLLYENKSCKGTLSPHPTSTPTSSAPAAMLDATSTPTITPPGPTGTPETVSSTPARHDSSACTPKSGNILANPSFEEGTANWLFYSNSSAAFDISGDAYQCEKAGRVSVSSMGNNMQLYQKSFLLKGSTRYRFSFAGRSSSGDDLQVYIHRHSSPYALYGLNGELFNLSLDWQTFSSEFTATGFSGTTTDTRLRFWFSAQASNGEIYWIDDVRLEEVVEPLSTPSGNSLNGIAELWERFRQFWVTILP